MTEPRLGSPNRGELAAVMAAHGLAPDIVVPDGKIHRFRDLDERAGRKSAWYVAFSDNGGGTIDGAMFGSWRRAISETWVAHSTTGRANEAMPDEWYERFVGARKARDAERQRQYARAARRAAKLYASARPAPIDHPYVIAKNLHAAPHARVDAKGTLLLPTYDPKSAQLTSVQAITRDGSKRWLKGARAGGTWLPLGGQPSKDQPVYVTEGYATACSIHEATGHPCVVAWTHSNLEAAAKATYAKWPHAAVQIAADNDQWTEGNPGVTSANKAGAATGAPVHIPVFEDTRTRPTDFNDMARLHGPTRVAEALKAVPPPPPRILDRADPMGNARRFLRDNYTVGGRPTIYSWKNDFYAWSGRHYPVLEHAALFSKIYHYLEAAERYDRQGTIQPFVPTGAHVDALITALGALTHIGEADCAPPAWLDGRATPAAKDVISTQAGLLHLTTRRIQKHSPEFFTQTTLPYAYDEDAQPPKEWLRFLNSLWPHETNPSEMRTQDVLQEVFGYLLSGETGQQKIFLLVGPPRSGKGTISKILIDLLGAANVASSTLSGFSQNFGLQGLIGKTLTLIPDARLSAKSDASVVVERLLSISGEDPLPVDRKHRDPWIGQLPTRILMLTNELPNLKDMSGALANRFILMLMTESFLGNEDTGLLKKLRPELSSILNWSLDGLARLRLRGFFLPSGASIDVMQELKDLSSPVSAFVRERCVLGSTKSVACDTLYSMWVRWCEESGHNFVVTKAMFGRDLRAAVPSMVRTQERLPGGQRVWVYRGVGIS